MAAFVNQLSSMRSSISEELIIPLLIASIEAPDLAVITATIKTQTDEKVEQ